MFDGQTIFLLGLAYVGVLFVIAWLGDRFFRSRKGGAGRPFIYALSLAVYCTSWTFFGSVGLAAATGYDFIPVYLGPILMFSLGWPIIARIVRLSKSQNLTSVADFVAARYGKSLAVGAVVTLVAVAGTLPYIALQLKAVVISTEVLIGGGPLTAVALPSIGFVETAFVAALALAVFAVLFGTRHIDATEHQDGLMLAVAAESVVKLAAFLIVGIYVVFFAFGSGEEFLERARQDHRLQELFGRAFDGGKWITVTILSLACIVLLPRQFHVTVVENNTEEEVRRAAWLFPIYLVLINLFVVPIAAGGLMAFPTGEVVPDMFVLGLPIARGNDVITMLAYIGGLSAATAMVVVESVALAIMLCNGVIVPLLLRQRVLETGAYEDLAGLLLTVRRFAIFAILLAGYAVHHALGGVASGLAAIGLLSFAAIAQLAPAFFGGLIWRRATARGAIAGMLAGFSMWAYTLLLPWAIKAGWAPASILADGPLGIGLLKPQALFFLGFDPLTHGVFWSLAVNVACYIVVSLLSVPEPIERVQAHIFVHDDLPRTQPAPAFKLWRTSITVGDLQETVARYLGAERAERSFAEFAQSRNQPLTAFAEADLQTVRFAEHLLTSAIGAASSRLVLTLLLRRANVGSQSALKLLDDASEALQYNRDLLQSALDQVRHGLAVFDKELRLVCWNRQYRELLSLPPDLGRVGMPIDRILRVCAERGDFGAGPVNELVADRLMRLAVTGETFSERMAGGRTIEIRTAPMPQGGFVTTFSDITDRMEAANALSRANETLERRVRERTAELLELNGALAVAKARADEANLDKTRFLAAASHDILQPLNAARLFSTSLLERKLDDDHQSLARNIDASLAAVEEILGALIDLSRMDTGRMEPDIGPVALNDLFKALEVEFAPLAEEKGLRLAIVPTRLWVRTDRRLLRRMLQNLVSNAIKYTHKGGVVLGVRRRGPLAEVQIVDSGPGIPRDKQSLVFKEFHRLESATGVRGLGLGLSIVERIGRVLDAPITLRSQVGRGSTFAFRLPVTQAARSPAAAAERAVELGQLSGTTVLCIDNEPAVLAGMKALLGGWGCKVLLADSAPGGVDVVSGACEPPDVIIADYHLDVGTGIDAIELIRKAIGRPTPAIVITADHSRQVQRSVRELGYELLRKPVKAAQLRALITHNASKPRAQAAAE